MGEMKKPREKRGFVNAATVKFPGGRDPSMSGRGREKCDSYPHTNRGVLQGLYKSSLKIVETTSARIEAAAGGWNGMG